MATLELQGIKKHYGGIRAVDGIDLTVADGEFLAILGPSGCGKSTTMRMIAGLELPTTGQIRIGGQDVTRLPPRARNVSMVFQSYALYPSMSVTRNIAFPLRTRGVARAERDRKVAWAAGIMGIEHLLDRMPARLSGGEKQRVALARALVHDPALFIFDEPLSALDAQVRARARTELRGLHDRTGVTTVYVTHDQVEALSMGDRVAVMQAGRVRQIGTPQELYDHPADTFVAGFLGSPPMNLLPRDGRIAGFRAEYLTLVEAADAAEAGLRLTLRIERIEFLGAMWLVHAETAGDHGDEKIIARVVPEVAERLRAGETHVFSVPTRWLRWFDPQSGLRVGDGAA